MGALGELLFYQRSGVGLDDVLRHRTDQEARQAVEAISESAFSTQSDDEITQAIVNDLHLTPLGLVLDKANANVKEITVNVTDVFGQRGQVKGLRATKSIPFIGDPDLWRLQPNPYDLNPPRGDILGSLVILGMDIREHEGDQAAGHIQQSIQKITEYIARQAEQLRTFHSSLPARVLPLVQQRRARLGTAADLLKKLQQ